MGSGRMRRFYVSLTVLGIGSLGAFLFTERGQCVLQRVSEIFRHPPNRWLEWNEDVQQQLDRIQEALNRIAESLEPHPELGQ